MQATRSIEEQIIQTFKGGFRGKLITPEHRDYDEYRSLYNGMIDKRPALIARCTGVADVMAAVNFGRNNHLHTAIRGGGHNGPGLGSCDGGLVIDLSQMKGVRVDPETKTVRVEAGCTTGDLDHATHAFGLAVPTGIISSTGISGLTLGGGHGYLSRKFGLTIDNLLEADIVLADGSFVTVNSRQHSDLFWAIRGGGGNFGVVTGFVFELHPVSMVYAGPVAWKLEDARHIMKVYREFLPDAPTELSAFLGLKTVLSTPPFPEEFWGEKICLIMFCYNGTEKEDQNAIKPLLEKLPKPIFNWLQILPYPALQAMFDPLYPKGYQWYWKGDFVTELSDEVIEKHLENAAKLPSELSLMHLYPIDGAVHRVDPTETAWIRRDATWSMVIAGIDPDPNKADDLKQWSQNYWEALSPFNDNGAYINFMMEEGEERIKAFYGTNYSRLVEIKRKYDSENFFRINQNIKP
ncbi:FAD-binding oxidoreductase [Algoriphagus resistens]|uniref:FAD-binding oxidoreductase n=1 Tax=Algoriphagus resistens TaxID=1750590 RepID=UPI000716AD92|nr:FAD-binding oxidoreductase [Algoriphagus resistens]